MATDKIVQNMEVIGADGVPAVPSTVSLTVASGSRSATAAKDSRSATRTSSTSDWLQTSRSRGFAFRRTRLWR